MKETINKIYSSDLYMKKQEKTIMRTLVVGVILISTYVLFKFEVFNYEDDLKGILYIGLFLVILSLFSLLRSKTNHTRNRVTYCIEDKVFIVSPYNRKKETKYSLDEFIFKGKIYSSNLGLTKTNTLVLEDRQGKKKRINCALDEKSFEALLSDLVNL